MQRLQMFDGMSDEQNSSKAQADIDANLRRAYDEVISQEVPQRFRVLLEKLRAGEGSATDNENGEPNSTGDRGGAHGR
ncbi:MAG: NepR family anti-sigma factor [Pseudomonadota bacterium]